jgi:apolipoprotein D and lipocalin family protein
MRRNMLLLAALAAATAFPAAAAGGVSAVPALDLSRYAGQWHEIARLPMAFQRQCVAASTAHYTLRDDGMVGVRNACRNASGQEVAAEGVARPVAGEPGKLQVRFAPDMLRWLPFVWADYWVIDLDPGYQWAVVGEPRRRYLWVLSRTPTMDASLLAEIRQRAIAQGYDLDRLIVSAPLRQDTAGRR